MAKDLTHLSESDLAEMITNAQRALAQKEAVRRKEVLAEIKQLADSIGVVAVVKESGEGLRGGMGPRIGSKVPVKYRNPSDSSQQWTGRGVRPKWLVALLEEGRQIEEFRI